MIDIVHPRALKTLNQIEKFQKHTDLIYHQYIPSKSKNIEYS